MSRASTKESTDQKDLHAQRELGCLSKNELAGEAEVLCYLRELSKEDG